MRYSLVDLVRQSGRVSYGGHKDSVRIINIAEIRKATDKGHAGMHKPRSGWDDCVVHVTNDAQLRVMRQFPLDERQDLIDEPTEAIEIGRVVAVDSADKEQVPCDPDRIAASGYRREHDR